MEPADRHFHSPVVRPSGACSPKKMALPAKNGAGKAEELGGNSDTPKKNCEQFFKAHRQDAPDRRWIAFIYSGSLAIFVVDRQIF